VIFIDPRFGSEQKGARASHREVAELLPKLGIDVEPLGMEYGDFAWFGNGPDGPIPIGVELKTVPDFVSSMLSGRLGDHQVPGLLDTYRRVYLIIEGEYQVQPSGLLEVPGRGGRWVPVHAGSRPVFWPDTEKFLAGLEEAGIRVRRTLESAETANVIGRVLYSFWAKDYDKHTSIGGLYKPPFMQLVREDPTTHRLRLVASSLPGIGHGRSKAVAQKFRSIRQMVNAEASEWEEIEGIGRTIGEDVVKAVCEEIPIRSEAVSNGCVPARRGARAQSPRHSRRDQGSRVDAGTRAERRVPTVGAGRRKSGGSIAE
jgi:ERCC4-type nuclease